MITISNEMEQEENILLRSYLKENIKDKNDLRVKYDIPNEQQVQIDGTSYTVKKVRFEGMEER